MSEAVPIGNGPVLLVTERLFKRVLSQGVIHSMAGIRVKEGESFEGALKRFKKKCEKAGILSDLRRHQYFEKPSERRKRKIAAARRKMLKAQALQKD